VVPHAPSANKATARKARVLMLNLISREMFAAEDAPQTATARQKSGARTFTNRDSSKTARLSRGALFASAQNS
jgi:hypothetical protein